MIIDHSPQWLRRIIRTQYYVLTQNSTLYRTLEEPHFVFLQCEWLVVSEEQDNSKWSGYKARNFVGELSRTHLPFVTPYKVPDYLHRHANRRFDSFTCSN